LTWSETSSKSARPAKDFESWETVSIAESTQYPEFKRRNREWSEREKRHNQSRLYVIGALEELEEFERARKRFGKKAEGYTGECYGCANRADSRFTRHWQTFSNFGEFVVIFVVTRASFRADFGPFYLGKERGVGIEPAIRK
jgi:hypothetical protein